MSVMLGGPTITRSDVVRLVKQAAAGNAAARERLNEMAEQLASQYAQSRDPQLRELAVEANMPLARFLARRFTKREEYDDLVQVAGISLLLALDRFDPARGVMFSTFATVTITGDLKKHLRNCTWRFHVQRSIKEYVLQLGEIRDYLSHELGRQPRPEELRAALDVDEDTWQEVILASRSNLPVSIDAPVGDQQGVIDLTDDNDWVDQYIHRAALAQVMQRLPESQRRVLELRFDHEMTQAEIGQRMGISQMHVSRQLGQALAKLRVMGHELISARPHIAT